MTMTATIDAVQQLLHSSEEAVCVLEVFESLSSDKPIEESNELFLAVIVHVNPEDEHEEGSLLLWRRRPSAHEARTEVQQVIPIYRNFSINIAHNRRATLDTRQSAEFVLNQSHSVFTLTINGGSASPPLEIGTHDTHSLHTLLAECRRLQETAHIESTQTSEVYSWLLPYTTSRYEQLLKFQLSPDLRIINQVLSTRLSPASAGLPGDDDADMVLIQDEWVRSAAWKASWEGKHSLQIRLGTFNVNGQLPTQDLSPWVRGSRSSSESGRAQQTLSLPPLKNARLSTDIRRDQFNMATKVAGPEVSLGEADLLVFGFQELDLSTEALIYYTSTAREDAWCTAIFASLGEKAVLYEKLASRQLVGMLIIIIVKTAIKSCFSEIKSCVAGSGLMGLMGNKGGTAIRLKYTPPTQADLTNISWKPTILTFVNSHLAAFDEMIDRRNLDFHDLSKRLMFEQDLPSNAVEPLSTLSIYETDVLFWMGDLNYRIDLPDADVRDILATWPADHKLVVLYQHDQLRKVSQERKAFEQFKEHHLTHLPTYRFGQGFAIDSLGYDLKRRPAWTDRILYMSAPWIPINQLTYEGHREVLFSDHRPVSADILVEIPMVDGHKHDNTFRDLLCQISQQEQEDERPIIRLDSTAVEFGQIYYHRTDTRTLQVQNTGKIPCAFRFIPIKEGGPVCPDWIAVSPSVGFLLPNETMDVTVMVCIDHKTAARMNLTSKRVGTSLILHTLHGKDHFVSVGADYQYTCFANELSTLTRLPRPIRTLQSTDELLPENRAINAPREIMRLINWMMKSVNLDTLYTISGNQQLVDPIRECLDTGAEFPYLPDKDDPEASQVVGNTLLQLLSSFTEPLVPYSLQSRCVQMTSRDEAFEFLDFLSPPAVNVWISVTAFLQYLCQITCEKEPDVHKRIASVFVNALLPNDPSPTSVPVSPIDKIRFLQYFIS